YTSNTEQNVLEMRMFNPITPLFLTSLFESIIGRTCKKLLDEPGLIDRLRDEEFDVFIVENFEVCGMGISEAIRPKAFEEFRVPQALSHRPTLFHSSLDVHSFFSRLLNLIGEVFIRVQFILSRLACARFLKERFGPDYPSVASQSSHIAYLLTNSEPLLESAAPTLSRVIDISRIGAKQPRPLNEYWEGVLSLRPRSILLSLGSMAKSYLLPERTKEGILKEEDEFSREMAVSVPNLILNQWLPQVDLLNDDRVVLFITHGGMGSAQETAASGVPGIFIPIFGDQPRNAGMMEYSGLGVVFDKFDLHDDDKLAAAIREVTENPKYREKASLVSRMLTDSPFKAKEKLIRHVEFAAEFGPSPALRPLSHDMSLVEYHNLDIIVIILIVMLFSLYFTVKISVYI
ncbi:hypothetical protein PMAYCL1PPCAC_17637, partial [Pristionchus mayeri]